MATLQIMGFALASMLCIVAPGPDNLLVLSVGISKGRRAGMGFALGCALGCLTHTLWAVVGLSALVAASAMAFQVIKWLGAIYLFYLAYLTLRSGAIQVQSQSRIERSWSLMADIRKGFLANSLNPKVALFFLAFLPQFINNKSQVALQTLLLGTMFSAMVAVLFVGLGYFSGAIGNLLKKNPNATRWLDRVAAFIFVGLGLRLVFSTNR